MKALSFLLTLVMQRNIIEGEREMAFVLVLEYTCYI